MHQLARGKDSIIPALEGSVFTQLKQRVINMIPAVAPPAQSFPDDLEIQTGRLY